MYFTTVEFLLYCIYLRKTPPIAMKNKLVHKWQLVTMLHLINQSWTRHRTGAATEMFIKQTFSTTFLSQNSSITQILRKYSTCPYVDMKTVAFWWRDDAATIFFRWNCYLLSRNHKRRVYQLHVLALL